VRRRLMTEHVTASEIADLMRRIHVLHNQRPRDPIEQADILAIKAELLARIADQRAQEWGPCDDTTRARDIADEALAIAANAGRLVRLHRPPGGANSQEHPPPF
jgi:hypothetical protein